MTSLLNRQSGSVVLKDRPFLLESGEILPEVCIAYETYGVLNEKRDNVILLCHALTGNAHAAGVEQNTRGWWDQIIGPGKGFDTSKYFVICSNVPGSCYGSTGPASINSITGKAYGSDFPWITIRDIVRAQRLLVDTFGIERLAAVAGGSMGGMQTFEWGALYPDHVTRLILIATAPQQSAWRAGAVALAREVLALSRIAGDEREGLRLARMAAMLTYRSHEEFTARFGQEQTEHSTERSAVEKYLHRKGAELAERFDPLSYEVLLNAMQRHDISRGRGTMKEVLGSLSHPALCIGITSDMLYPGEEMIESARMMPNGIYREIESRCGHDAFLIEHEQLNHHIGNFLHSVDGTDRSVQRKPVIHTSQKFRRYQPCQ